LGAEGLSQMPKYFFDAHDVYDLVDEVGVEFPDLHAVRRELARTMAETAVDLFPANPSLRELSIEVRDEARMVVLRAYLTFRTESGS
jgi:hypothetical protein